MQLQKKLLGCHASLDDVGREFVEWMNANEFSIHPNIELRYIDSYYGHCVYSNDSIKVDEILFKISNHNVLSWQNCKLYELLPKLKLPGWNNLILGMMFEEACPDSFWRPYLKILPEELNTPVFWTDVERAELKGTQVLDTLGMKKILKDYKTFIVPLQAKLAAILKSLHPQVEYQFDISKYKKFGSLIMAYSFTLDSGEVVMVPAADMLNYKIGINNAHLFVEYSNQQNLPKKNSLSKYEFKMKVTRDVGVDEELLNIYGDLSNSDLLLKYGYVENWDLNHWNDVDVSILKSMKVMGQVSKLEKSDLKARFKFVTQNNLVDIDGVFHFYDNNGRQDGLERGLTDDFVILVKIFAANTEQWCEIEKCILTVKKANSNSECEYLLESEKVRKALMKSMPAEICMSKISALMKAVFESRLAEYENSSYEDDARVLAEESNLCDISVRRKWMALSVRCGEKYILSRLIQETGNLVQN